MESSFKSSPSLTPASSSSVSSLRTAFSQEDDDDDDDDNDQEKAVEVQQQQQHQRSQSHNLLMRRLHPAQRLGHQRQQPHPSFRFSLDVSPKMRSKFQVLSPISDKSQEVGDQHELPPLPSIDQNDQPATSERSQTRPLSLFCPRPAAADGSRSGAGLNGSDSGISISTHSSGSHDTALASASFQLIAAPTSLYNSRGNRLCSLLLLLLL